jgi:hypothetical protein
LIMSHLTIQPFLWFRIHAIAHYFLLIIDTCFLIILFAMFVNLDSLFGAGNVLLC